MGIGKTSAEVECRNQKSFTRDSQASSEDFRRSEGEGAGGLRDPGGGDEEVPGAREVVGRESREAQRRGRSTEEEAGGHSK